MESSVKRYPIGTQIDKYKILSVLGEGGIGIVYKVYHQQLDTCFALKMCKIQDVSVYERLKIEGRAQTKLKHPHIVSVLNMITYEDSPGIVMELVEGVSLDQWLYANSPDQDTVETIFQQILDAMSYAHSRHVIHRDLKPSNILISQYNTRPFAKVCDFGLAKIPKAKGHTLTQTGAMMGTPAYMSPEQIRNSKDVDQRTDIFSLGAIFYEMVTGHMAFNGADTLELLNAVANESPIAPSLHVSNLERRHLAAIYGALEKIPEKRIQDCEMFRSVLRGEKWWKIPLVEDRTETTSILGDSDATEPIQRTIISPPSIAHSTETITRSKATERSLAETKPQKTVVYEPLQSNPSRRWNSIWFVGLLVTVVVALLVVVSFVVLEEKAGETEEMATEHHDIEQEIVLSDESKSQTVEKTKATETQKKRVSTTKNRKSKGQIEIEIALNPSKKEKKKEEIRKKAEEAKKAEETQKKEKKQIFADVSFEGADALWLQKNGEKYPAGKVPEGTYTVYARFGSAELSVRQISLKAGEKRHIRCTPLRKCN